MGFCLEVLLFCLLVCGFLTVCYTWFVLCCVFWIWLDAMVTFGCLIAYFVCVLDLGLVGVVWAWAVVIVLVFDLLIAWVCGCFIV